MNLIKTLENYKENYPLEANIVKKYIEFYSKNKEKGFFRECLNGHFTGSIFVVNKDYSKTLLMHHKKLNKWLNFGGHADGDIDLKRVAIRELEEEAGIQIEKNDLENFLDLDLQIIPSRIKEPEHYHYDFRFLTSIDDNILFNMQESEVNEIKWINISDLGNYDITEGVIKIINKINK